MSCSGVPHKWHFRRQPPKAAIGVAFGLPWPLGRRPGHFPTLERESLAQRDRLPASSPMGRRFGLLALGRCTPSMAASLFAARLFAACGERMTSGSSVASTAASATYIRPTVFNLWMAAPPSNALYLPPSGVVLPGGRTYTVGGIESGQGPLTRTAKPNGCVNGPRIRICRQTAEVVTLTPID